MKKLYNDSEKISASEINRFSYCRYQWYYERKYGRKYLREQRAALMKSLGLTDTAKSNFLKGLEFHKNYRLRGRFTALIRFTGILLMLGLILLFILMKLGVLPWIF